MSFHQRIEDWKSIFEFKTILYMNFLWKTSKNLNIKLLSTFQTKPELDPVVFGTIEKEVYKSREYFTEKGGSLQSHEYASGKDKYDTTFVN